MKAAFLGPEGSYTDLALRAFNPPQEGIACNSFVEIFKAVDDGRADYGFVPLENVQKGPITETLDLLFQYHGRIFIDSTYTMKIEHCLGVLPGTKLTTVTQVHSREQALQQCASFLHETVPNAELVTARSSAAAAQHVQKNQLKHAAVIAAAGTLEASG